jgi:hypothetical protein
MVRFLRLSLTGMLEAIVSPTWRGAPKFDTSGT